MNSQDVFETLTHSPAETEALGEALAGLLDGGGVLALYGELAAGKTCLARGIAAHFGGGREAHSPTFTLINRYGNERGCHHLDLYRVDGIDALVELGLEELLDGEDACVIEWAERAAEFLPARRLDIRMAHAGNDTRRIRIENSGVLREGWELRLTSQLAIERSGENDE